MSSQRFINYRLKSFIASFIFFLVLITLCGISPAAAQDRAENILENAREKYEKGYFEQVISIMDSCLNNNIFTDHGNKEQAHELRARAYIAWNKPGKAEKDVKKLLKMNKNYKPVTPKDPTYIKLVEKTREEQRIQRTKSKLTYWIMGGTAVAIVSVLVLKPSETKEATPLPTPPGHPSGR